MKSSTTDVAPMKSSTTDVPGSKPRHDFGYGLSRCRGCGKAPIRNRGCKSCSQRVCSACFPSHVCRAIAQQALTQGISWRCKKGMKPGSVASTAAETEGHDACVEYVFDTFPDAGALNDVGMPEPPRNDWFSRLFGFSEMEYEKTKRWLRVFSDGSSCVFLQSLFTGATYCVGEFGTPSLAELRERSSHVVLPGRMRIQIMDGDVSAMIADPANQHAVFQVASQFNCLEFVSQHVVPEDGVTDYVSDRTQGPACSIACGPATVYRNYFAPIMGPDGKILRSGQVEHCQINNLADFSSVIGNESGRFFDVEGGYTMASDGQLADLNRALRGLCKTQKGKQRALGALRMGVHSGVQVTSFNWGRDGVADVEQRVTQVFNSACAVSYNRSRSSSWEPFAKLVLEASYEGVLLAALLEAEKHGGQRYVQRVFLTCVGGGVFGNETAWIVEAMQSALDRFRNFDLDVRIVCYGRPERELERLVQEF